MSVFAQVSRDEPWKGWLGLCEASRHRLPSMPFTARCHHVEASAKALSGCSIRGHARRKQALSTCNVRPIRPNHDMNSNSH